MKFPFFIKLLSAFCLSFFLSILPSRAIDCSFCEGKKPLDLIDLTLTMNSASMKEQIRAWLAEHHPDTAAGKMGGAWVGSNNGATPEEVFRLYEEAIWLAPDHFVPYVNLGVEQSKNGDYDLAIETYKQGLPHGRHDESLIRNIYFGIKTNLKDPKSAMEFLDNAEAQELAEEWVFDFVRGLDLVDVNREEAVRHYGLSLEKGGSTIVLENWFKNKWHLLAQQRADRNVRIELLNTIINWGEENGEAYPLRLAAKKYLEEFKWYETAFKLYERSFEIEPTPEAVYFGVDALAHENFDAAFDFLKRGSKAFPDNADILETLAWAHYDFLFEPNVARDYATEALKQTVLDTSFNDKIRVLASAYEVDGNFDSLVPVLEKYLDASRGSKSRQLQIVDLLFVNRWLAVDVEGAKKWMREFVNYNFSKSWVNTQKSRLERMNKLIYQRDQYLVANPFLSDWEKKIGDSLKVNVEFEVGKADIKPKSFKALDQAADALNAPGAEDYVFLIEGHTDNTGTDEINIPLSKARAASVKNYFMQENNVEPFRLQTIGYGPNNPAATNETENGRQINRRVEIRPYGNIAEPSVLTNSWLNAKDVDFSRDGRIAVTGAGPIQVWDTQRQVLLHQLPFGSHEREISPNGRYLAAISQYKEVSGTDSHALYIYDLRTGLVKAQAPSEREIIDLSWSPFSDELSWIDAKGFLKVLDLSTERIRDVNRIATEGGGQKLIWLNDGMHIVAKSFNLAKPVVFNAKTLERIGTLSEAGWVHSFGQNYDGKYLIAITNSREMVIWDTTTWEETVRKRSHVLGKHIISHPTEHYVLATEVFNSEIRAVMIDLRSGDIVAWRKGDPDSEELDGGFTPDGNTYLTALDGKLQYLDAEVRSLPIEREWKSQADKGKNIKVIEPLDLAVSSDAGGSSVWSLKTGRRVHRLNNAVGTHWRQLSEDGTIIWGITDDNRIVSFNANTFTEETIFEADYDVTSSHASDSYIAFSTAQNNDGNKLINDTEAQIIVLSKSDGKVVLRTSYQVVTEPFKYDGAYDLRPVIEINEEAGKIAIRSMWTDGFSRGHTLGKIVTILDIETGEELNSILANDRVTNIGWNNDGTELKIRTGRDWAIYNPDNGRHLRTEVQPPAYTLELSDGRIVNWRPGYIELYGQRIDYPETIEDVEAHEGLNLLVAMTKGNEVIFIDLNSFTTILTIASKSNGEWIAYAPSGEFTASINGADGVFWSLGDNFLPFEAFRERFERPDLLRKRLKETAEGKVVQEKVAEVEADVFDAPYTISLEVPKTQTTDEKFFVTKLKVVKSNSDLADPEIEYILNGRRILKSRGFEEEAVFEGEEIIGFNRRFDLQPGRNVLTASLIWRDARVQTQKIEINRTSAADVEKSVSGTTLWFFGVGVSDYELKSQNLNFAHRDAEELSKLLEKQEGVLFSSVKTLILTNEKATERNVRLQMNDFLSQAKDDDVIVVFMAGHGVVDAEQELYFATHDADLMRPFTGMPIDSVKRLLENRPINQRALLLLDICHAGAAHGRVVAEDAVQSLSKGTGAVVFASSSGSELSFEDEAFGGGHGAFTASILDGLRGHADSTIGNRDGLSSLQETILFTTSNVPKLTMGQQRPGYPNISGVTDYALAKNN